MSTSRERVSIDDVVENLPFIVRRDARIKPQSCAMLARPGTAPRAMSSPRFGQRMRPLPPCLAQMVAECAMIASLLEGDLRVCSACTLRALPGDQAVALQWHGKRV